MKCLQRPVVASFLRRSTASQLNQTQTIKIESGHPQVRRANSEHDQDAAVVHARIVSRETFVRFPAALLRATLAASVAMKGHT
jgi:hypothetical protein